MNPHDGKWIPWALNWFLTIAGAGLVLSNICLLVSPDSVFLSGDRVHHGLDPDTRILICRTACLAMLRMGWLFFMEGMGTHER
jgi:hypothetical protein